MFLKGEVEGKLPGQGIPAKSGATSVANFRVVDEEEVLPVKLTGKSGAEKPEVDDDVARLKEALAKAESQLTQLKLEKAAGKGPGESHELHARPLGPNMMPGPSIIYFD